MVPHLQRVLAAPEVDGIVIHPAMVYAGADGVFSRFAREAVGRDAIRVVGSEAVRWPLVHSEDLAALYALVLEQAPARESYIGVSVEALPVGRIARALARRFRTCRGRGRRVGRGYPACAAPGRNSPPPSWPRSPRGHPLE